jgi:hypothetical protein
VLSLYCLNSNLNSNYLEDFSFQERHLWYDTRYMGGWELTFSNFQLIVLYLYSGMQNVSQNRILYGHKINGSCENWAVGQ